MEKIPVPKFFWKIAYDEKTKKGIAVIGTNNIHRTEDKICTPIEEVPWLKFLDTTDITSGIRINFILIQKYNYCMAACINFDFRRAGLLLFSGKFPIRS